MNTEQEMEENLQEVQPKTLASFRESLQEKRKEEDEDTEIVIKHSDDKKKDRDDDDDDDDDRDEKKPFKKKKPSFFDKGGDDTGGIKPSPGIKEETASASTLHPGARKAENPKALDSSKVEKMKHAVRYMSGLDKSDFTDWFDKSIAVFGPGKDYGVGDVSGKNMASIDSKLGKGPKTKDPMPKLNVKEDLQEILGGTELSEEAIEKTATLFEAAVHLRSELEKARLEEEAVAIVTEELEHFTSTLTEKLDAYLNYVVENWMAENKIAVESTLTSEITRDFIDGLKGLFAEHYIDVPEEKIDVLEAMAEKVEMTESRLEEVLSENALMKDALIGGAKQEVIESVGKDLTQADKDKFVTLAEGIEFEGDFDAYAAKLTIVRDNYFAEKNKKVTTSNILSESFEGDDGSQKTTQYVDPAIGRYVNAMDRSIKRNTAANA